MDSKQAQCRTTHEQGGFKPKGDHTAEVVINKPESCNHSKMAQFVIVGALPDWNGKPEMEYQRLSKTMYDGYNKHLGENKCRDHHQWT